MYDIIWWVESELLMQWHEPQAPASYASRPPLRRQDMLPCVDEFLLCSVSHFVASGFLFGRGILPNENVFRAASASTSRIHASDSKKKRKKCMTLNHRTLQPLNAARTNYK